MLGKAVTGQDFLVSLRALQTASRRLVDRYRAYDLVLMSVPLYWSAEDLPIGVMFTGRPEDETMMFSLAAQLELARPWRERRAPVFVGKKNSL